MSVLTVLSRPTRTNATITSEISRWNAVWHPIVFKFQAPDDLDGSPPKSFYHIEIKVLEYSTGSPLPLVDEYARFYPDVDGVIRCDLQAWLQSMVAAKNEFNYSGVSAADKNISAHFNIQWREYWKEDGYSAFSDLSDDNLFYVTNSARQIGDTYGQNMLPFVVFPTDTGSPAKDAQAAKFLTKFKNPVYYENYPFDLQFIYSKELADAGQNLYRVEKVYDVAGNLLSTTETLLDDNNGYINRMKLAGGYDASAYKVEVYLKVKESIQPTSLVWHVTGGTPNIVYVLADFGGTNTIIGNALWDTNMATTMAALVNSINTNTDSDPTDSSAMKANTTFSTFDNSAGYTATYVGSTFTLIPPPGIGGDINDEYSYLYSWNGSLITTTESGAQIWADGSSDDAVGETTATVSETKTVLIGQCVDNPVYLSWLNVNGGWDYQMFEFTQEFADAISGEQLFNQYIEQLDQAEGRQQTLAKEVKEEITVAAENIDKDQVEGLRYLLRSIKAYQFLAFLDGMYIQSDQGDFILSDDGDYLLADQSGTFPTWRVVTVKGGTFPIKNSFESRTRLEVTINPPQPFNQQQ